MQVIENLCCFAIMHVGMPDMRGHALPHALVIE